ncbi:C6 finger domain-containing protein [Apiospora hydei]|uniref:C6 finger domain-containing protein n=1 Tax=Apiospora hydei TaxID=1337664 RepID=A0ABR1W938_9PEZI
MRRRTPLLDMQRFQRRLCLQGAPRLIGKLSLTNLETTGDNKYNPFRIEDASPSAVVDRLSRIEALLEQQSQQLRHLSPQSSPAFSPSQRSGSFPLIHQAASSFLDPPHPSADDLQDAHQFLIPRGVSLTSSLFLAPGIREQLGRYPRNFFSALEQSHAFSITSFMCTRTTPLFCPDVFSVWQTKATQNVAEYNIETAICLCVYALGTIAVPIPEGEVNESTIGLQLFKPALQIILHVFTWSFQPSLTACQALLLASTYFGYLGRPLHRGKMAYFAARMFLDHLEFNQAAELDVIRSGIEPLGDRMSLPRSMNQNMSDANDTISFVAEIALRRLLNRILSSLYSAQEAVPGLNSAPPASSPHQFPSSDTAALSIWQYQGLSLPKTMALSSELNRQLEQWYDSIPDGVEPIETDRDRTLRVRYYEARYLIHRPFVMQAAAGQQHQQQTISQADTFSSIAVAAAAAAMPTKTADTLPQVILDGCEVCIESCVAYLYNVAERLERRSAHLWSLAQNALACVLVLTMADGCPPLRPRCDTLVARVGRWATRGSSFEAHVAILQSLRFRGDDATAGGNNR